jgi:hypothetical protein
LEPIVAEIREFMGRRHPEVSAFLITLKKDSTPYVRQIGTFLEGWTVNTISRPNNMKMTQLRRNPSATYIWIQQFPDRLARNVWVQGDIEIIDDPAEVAAFMDRRAQALGARSDRTAAEPVLLRLRPKFLRAEYFRENPREYIMREFPDQG